MAIRPLQTPTAAPPKVERAVTTSITPASTRPSTGVLSADEVVAAKAQARSERAAVVATTSSRVAGDWMGGASSSGKEILEAAIARHGGPEPLVPPPPGTAVHTAALGKASLIGPSTSMFDPRASYAENLERLKAQGVPRFPLLTDAERAHETAFADAVQADPEHFVEGAALLAHNDALHTSVFEVDAMKRLSEGYGVGPKPADDDERAVRGAMNHALHPTAVTVARLAFLKQLDTLQALPAGDPRKQVFITNGGCAAGKSSLTDVVKRQLGDVPFGAVWDAAGEGDALENAWILDACQARGLKTVFGYVENNPLQQYAAVLTRAETAGRIVDVATYANSYVEGAKNMRAFLDSPAYKEAAAAGTTTAFGVYTGRFDPASVKDKTKPPYPDFHLLGEHGVIDAADVPRTPPRAEVLEASVREAERFIGEKQAQGAPTDFIVQGALLAAQKFIPTWEDA